MCRDQRLRTDVARLCALRIAASLPRASRGPGGCSGLSKFAPHRDQRGREITGDDFRLEPEDAIASAREPAISAHVSICAPTVIAAIHLDDEANTGGEEVYDETKHRDLPTKRHAELT
jgi:hypothetical protein